jgi:hypothetical protein
MSLVSVIAACPVCAAAPAEPEAGGWLLAAMMAAPFAVALIAGLLLFLGRSSR